MSKGAVDGIGLADAIGQIKAELLAAQNMPAAGGVRLPVKSVTVELSVVATRSADAKAGFKVPLIDLELGSSGTLSQERTHTITVVFDTPINEHGDPVQVYKVDDDPGL